MRKRPRYTLADQLSAGTQKKPSLSRMVTVMKFWALRGPCTRYHPGRSAGYHQMDVKKNGAVLFKLVQHSPYTIRVGNRVIPAC